MRVHPLLHSVQRHACRGMELSKEGARVERRERRRSRAPAGDGRAGAAAIQPPHARSCARLGAHLEEAAREAAAATEVKMFGGMDR